MANLLFQIILSALLAVAVKCQNFNINVLEHGAVGDGITNDGKSFKDAWEETCKSSASAPTLHIPEGKTFLLQPSVFSGPCTSNNVTVVIDGTLVAPTDPSDWDCNDNNCDQWIKFMHIDGLFIHGTGSINPEGRKWWDRSCDHKEHHCHGHRRPTGFVIAHSNNTQIDGLTFKDSPKMHIAIESSTRVHLSNLNIQAPEDSPNTDGIHIQNSQFINIEKIIVGTGDDCISIGDGSSNIDISRIACGPGHGISIGSLGRHRENETVENVHVTNVIFRDTQNGARIKTWQGGSGYARNVVFERIISYNAKHPIIIDQYYCDQERCKNQTSAVEVSNITYNQIVGTSPIETPVRLACSESVQCKSINMQNVYIQSTKRGRETASFCLNAKGRRMGLTFPDVPCLTRL